MSVFKRILSLILVIVNCIAGFAVIANPEPVTVTQPDGKEVTLQLHGDEYFSYTTTSAGYTVVKNPGTGAWEYATLNAEGELVANGELAYDNQVASTGVKHLKPVVSESKRMKQIQARRNVLTKDRYDYTKFRGLVILVEYNDCPFMREDYQQLMDRMINEAGYTGYMTTHLLPSKIACTGSVRDYYYENSNKKFDPVFDVVGPVKIDYSQHYARKSSGASALVNAALKAADELVDYKLYDGDGNKEVDMVFFIFSGAGSNYSGNEDTLIWPHASQVLNLSLDGVSFGRYACSTELYGSPSAKLLDGIGTICHEFSHVLGLPDLYDVDYETGGQAVHPQKWSIMASGSYLDKSKTPCGYSLFERSYLGFADPIEIIKPGTYTIPALNVKDNPVGYRINSAIPNEYFIFESRIQERWDAYLPGEGMLAYRVDRTDDKIWENNRVNATAARPYYELLRATPKISSSKTITDGTGDPFPGSGEKSELSNSTSPSLRSWTTTSTPLILSNIVRNPEDGSVTITVEADDTPTYVEDFNSMNATEADMDSVVGKFTYWKLSGGSRVCADEENGNFVSTVKSSALTCYPFKGVVETCAIDLSNPTTQSAIFRLHYSLDGGATWKAVSTLEGTANPSVAREEEKTVSYSLGGVEGAMFRLTQYTGSNSSPCEVKRVVFTMKAGTVSAVKEIPMEFESEDLEVEFYTLQGIKVKTPSASGIYIRKQGGKSTKIYIR